MPWPIKYKQYCLVQRQLNSTNLVFIFYFYFFLYFNSNIRGVGIWTLDIINILKSSNFFELQSSWHPSSYKNEQIYTWKCDVNAILVFIFLLGLHKIFCHVSLFYSTKPHARYIFILDREKTFIKMEKRQYNQMWKENSSNAKINKSLKMKKEVH